MYSDVFPILSFCAAKHMPDQIWNEHFLWKSNIVERTLEMFVFLSQFDVKHILYGYCIIFFSLNNGMKFMAKTSLTIINEWTDKKLLKSYRNQNKYMTITNTNKSMLRRTMSKNSNNYRWLSIPIMFCFLVICTGRFLDLCEYSAYMFLGRGW